MAAQLTMTQFKVDLAQLQDSVGVVSAQAGDIDNYCQSITTLMQEVAQMWVSPAGQTFQELIPPCTKQMHALTELLAQMVRRMKAAHETYVTMERTNTQNLQ
jgi:WXG100 family type VII secretion target